MRNWFRFLLVGGWLLSAPLVSAQLIVAHRGASFDAPENTLAAFRLAWEQQADAIEGDFYVTKDCQIVCIHDKTTKRVAPDQPELTVADSTLEELRKLDVGTWKDARFSEERIPTLGEVLKTVPFGKQIFVEIKCGPEIVPLLQSQLDESGLCPAQVVIICFNETVIREVRQSMPEYRANWLTGFKQKKPSEEWKPAKSEVLESLGRTGATGLGSSGNLEVIDQEFVDAVRETGTDFHVWTVNEIDAARKFAEFGVDSITTDRPKFIRDALAPAPAAPDPELKD
ncbi:MAG: glycerophosphodiester phosphodiesterase [Planctomycetaceae bacterium]